MLLIIESNFEKNFFSSIILIKLEFNEIIEDLLFGKFFGVLSLFLP